MGARKHLVQETPSGRSAPWPPYRLLLCHTPASPHQGTLREQRWESHPPHQGPVRKPQGRRPDCWMCSYLAAPQRLRITGACYPPGCPGWGGAPCDAQKLLPTNRRAAPAWAREAAHLEEAPPVSEAVSHHLMPPRCGRAFAPHTARPPALLGRRGGLSLGSMGHLGCHTRPRWVGFISSECSYGHLWASAPSAGSCLQNLLGLFALVI